jgi:hypothetical protein
VQGAVPVGAPAFTARSGSRMSDLDAETDCCLVSPHVMGNCRARVMPSAAYSDVARPFDTSIARP